MNLELRGWSSAICILTKSPRVILLTPKVQNHWHGVYKDLQDARGFLGWEDSKGILGSLRVDEWTPKVTLPGQPEGQVVSPADTRTILLPIQSLLGKPKIYSPLITHAAIDLRSTCKKPIQNRSPGKSPEWGCPGSLLVLSYFFLRWSVFPLISV